MSAVVLHIGVDAGGSRSRLVAWPSDDAGGQIRLQRDGPGANARILGTEGAADVLAALIREVLDDRFARVVVAAGVAGAGRPGDREDLCRALSQRLPCAESDIVVVADADLALDAAFGPEGAGLVVIAGTGSIAYARDDDGVLYRAGGWGRLLGDDGGGYRLGLRGLQSVCDALDGGPPTALRALAATMWDAPDAAALLAALYDGGRSPASFAPLVLEAAWTGDPVALQVVAEATEALAQRAAWVVERAGPLPRRFALVGGLTDHPGYRAALVRAVGEILPGWTLARPGMETVEAALMRARRLA